MKSKFHPTPALARSYVKQQLDLGELEFFQRELIAFAPAIAKQIGSKPKAS